jgi:hypothetical protein
MKQLTLWVSVWSCSFSATSLGSVTLLSAWFPLFALRHKPALLEVRGGPRGIPRRRAQGHVPEGSETSARARREWPRRVAVATAVRLGKRARPAGGEVTEADLRFALPILDSVTPVALRSDHLTLQGTATLFGVLGTVTADVRARDGAQRWTCRSAARHDHRVRRSADRRVPTIGAVPNSNGFSVSGGRGCTGTEASGQRHEFG